MFDFISSLSFSSVLDLLGTFAFAISGIRLASAKNFDWFGAYVIGFVTAIGGGTVRDLLLNTTPFWMKNPSYLIVTGIALVGILIFGKGLKKIRKTLFLFDTIGLALFTVVGIAKTLAFGFPFWVAIIMGTITGSVGGVIRDVLINEIPLLFRRDIYALACIAGGIVYYISFSLGFSPALITFFSAAMIILIRIIAVRFHIQVPTLKGKVTS